MPKFKTGPVRDAALRVRLTSASKASIEDYARRHHITMTQLVEIAIRRLLADHDYDFASPDTDGIRSGFTFDYLHE